MHGAGTTERINSEGGGQSGGEDNPNDGPQEENPPRS